MTANDTTGRTRRLLDSLPDRPGVYVFRDAGGKVLYVGKAKSLRKRVMSYFQKGGAKDGSLRIARMVKSVRDFDFVTTANETEALLLEANFIKHHRPQYNIMLRDDKSYPYVAVTLNEAFPRVVLTRRPHTRGVAYFGPFVSVARLRETLDLLGKIFPYRKCRGPEPGRHTGSPCLNYHIGLCLAPCTGKVDQVTYRQMIHKVERLLAGKPEGLTDEIRQAMQQAAAGQRYEEAALWRNRLGALEHLLQKQHAMATGLNSLDVIGIHTEGDSANVQVLQVRDGDLIDRRTFFLKNVAGEAEADIIEQFIIHYYASPIGLPGEVVVPGDITDTTMLKDYLTDQKGTKVEVRVGNRGKRRQLSEMATRNAVLALKQDQLREEEKKGRPARALSELRETLGLGALPRRIECYDISNIGGEHAVGSMVVFEDGIANPFHYRRFSIKGVSGPDDFAMMAEVLSRRFSHGDGEESPAPAEASPPVQQPPTPILRDTSFASRPDLIVVDGGAGQVSAAAGALKLLGETTIPVIGLAKKFEEIFVAGRRQPLLLPPDAYALGLLQRLRDEAHRFAVTYHRQKRGREVTSSVLDGIPGVGPARKHAILKHFGSPERFLAARSDELEAVPGLPDKVARDVYTYLHKLGKD
ncbi:MAG: excinuclease ABC subunit UvrC [Thermoleophilia bacterium]